MVHWVTKSGTTIDSEWQRMKSNENEWYNEWQRVIRVKCLTTRENESQIVTTNENEWQQMTAIYHLLKTNENDTVHFKERMTVIKQKTDTLLQEIHGCSEWLNN